MATQIPPPPKKKPRLQAPVDALPDVPASNVVIQFTDAQAGAIGPAVSLSSDTPREGLELLVNSLQKQTDDPVPYNFQVAVKTASQQPDGEHEDTVLNVDKSLHQALAKHPDLISSEQVLVVRCTPQAVFKVREITRCSAAIDGHQAPILCAAFAPTGSMLATGSGDNNARIWDIDTETPKATLAGHTGWVLCLEWDGLERQLATGSLDKSVRLWDPKSGRQVGEPLRGHSKWITSLAWEPVHVNASNPRLASSSKDGTVRVWMPQTKRTMFTLGGHTASVNVVRWGGEGVIYTASSDRTVKLWNAEEGKLIRTLSEHAHWVNTLALNTDFLLRTGPFDEKAKKQASDSEAQNNALKRYKDFTAHSPEQLISGSDDHTLFLWHPLRSETGNPKKPLARLTGHQKQVNHVAFSPDGRLIASAGFDNAVKLWNGKTGKFIASLRGHVAAVYRLSWSADSRMLVSASKDSTLKLWDLKTNKIRVDLPGHTDEVYCVDFVADKVASGGRDKKLRIWRH